MITDSVKSAQIVDGARLRYGTANSILTVVAFIKDLRMTYIPPQVGLDVIFMRESNVPAIMSAESEGAQSVRG
ncbi:hypothetical protein GCM10010433_43570 [Streptomyces pulveraceus]